MLKLADGTAFLRAREDSVLDEITTRIAALLHLPAQLADMNDGYTVHVKVPRKASSGPVTPERYCFFSPCALHFCFSQRFHPSR